MDETRQDTKDALKTLIDNAINDAKKELEDKKDHFRESRDAIDALRALAESKKRDIPVLNTIQAIVAVLVVIISLAGSWYNSKIETNDFFNELRHLKTEVSELKERVKVTELTHYEHDSDYKLLNQRLDILIRDFEKYRR